MYRVVIADPEFLRLRQVDVKAEHFERQVAVAEKERDAWEVKYEVRIVHLPTPGYRLTWCSRRRRPSIRSSSQRWLTLRPVSAVSRSS
jgi:hypothetical protein